MPAATPPPRPVPLFEGTDWNFQSIQRIHAAVEKIALEELGLDVYPNRIEVITSEQMLDAYASTGMPLFYKHWSFGKQFVQNEVMYRKGLTGLAYEIVINSNPCISYIMEENSATMQALVIAHAAFGHNHFFKNNYTFKQWTDAGGILDYLEFARGFIARCEDRYGPGEVERLLDAAHALQGQGVHRFPRKRIPDLRSEALREEERRKHGEAIFNDLWRTVPAKKRRTGKEDGEARRRALLGLPEENVLYFLEKTSPRLQSWQREVLRIVRQIAQYFYPQRQTKLMNEGCATFVHYRIMTRLHEQGLITDGSFMEFLHSHTNVVTQPSFTDRRYNGINPYAIGHAMMEDIARIVREPTPEDRDWFPEIAGSGDEMAVLRDVWANYRDESFVSQFLSPHLIRQFGLFHVHDDSNAPTMKVEAIHDEKGYRQIRRILARQYDVAWRDPDIQVVDVDLAGDRRLVLHHRVVDGVLLEAEDAQRVLQHLANLWGYEVVLYAMEGDRGAVLDEITAQPSRAFA